MLKEELHLNLIVNNYRISFDLKMMQIVVLHNLQINSSNEKQNIHREEIYQLNFVDWNSLLHPISIDVDQNDVLVTMWIIFYLFH